MHYVEPFDGRVGPYEADCGSPLVPARPEQAKRILR